MGWDLGTVDMVISFLPFSYFWRNLRAGFVMEGSGKDYLNFGARLVPPYVLSSLSMFSNIGLPIDVMLKRI